MSMFDEYVDGIRERNRIKSSGVLIGSARRVSLKIKGRALLDSYEFAKEQWREGKAQYLSEVYMEFGATYGADYEMSYPSAGFIIRLARKVLDYSCALPPNYDDGIPF